MQYATSCRTLLLAPGLPAPVPLALMLLVLVHFVILLHNFKSIYAVLSRIWKCHKSRVFGANVLGEKFRWCYIFRFLQLWPETNLNFRGLISTHQILLLPTSTAFWAIDLEMVSQKTCKILVISKTKQALCTVSCAQKGGKQKL